MTSAEWVLVWVTIGSCVGACFVSLIGGTWILRNKFDDFDKDQRGKVTDALCVADKKVARVYERLDEYKTFIEGRIESQSDKLDGRYVCQTVCNILHAKTAEQVAKLKTMMSEGFKRLEEKIEKK